MVKFGTAPIVNGWSPLGKPGAYTGFAASITGIYSIGYRCGVQLVSGAGRTSGGARLVLNGSQVLGSEAGITPATTLFATNNRSVSDLDNTVLVNISSIPAIIGLQFGSSAASRMSLNSVSPLPGTGQPTCASLVISRIQ